MQRSVNNARNQPESSPVRPNLSDLQYVLDKTNEENFKVIAKGDSLDIQTLILRSWIAPGVKTADIYLSYHDSSCISEVSIGESSMIGNSLIDCSKSYTVKIGELSIHSGGTKFDLTLNEEATKLIQESKDNNGHYQGFAQIETLYRINDLKHEVQASIDYLDKQSKLFGGARFYGIPDMLLERALQDEGLENDPRFKTFQSTGVLNIDALGQLSHRERYQTAIKEFRFIRLISLVQIETSTIRALQQVEKMLELVPDEERGATLVNFRISRERFNEESIPDGDTISDQHDLKFHLTVLGYDQEPIARAIVYRLNREDSRLIEAYQTAIEDGADAKGGIIFFEITDIKTDAPKGTTDTLKDLVNIVFAQTNCETLVELDSSLEQTSLHSTYSLQVEQSQLAASRMLRMAAGQILLAQMAAKEVMERTDMSQSDKDSRCETIGRDLNCWFQLALSSLMPSEHVTDQTLHVEEWQKWVEDSALYSVLDNARRSSFYSQFKGEEWFNNTSDDYYGSWNSFYEKGASRIIDAISTNREGTSEYVAEFQLSTLTPSIRSSLAAILQKWRIDESKKHAQLGLEWSVTEEELQGYLNKDSAIFHITVRNGEPTGVGIGFTDIQIGEIPEESMPSVGGSETSKKWCDDNNVPYEDILYYYLFGVDKEENPEMPKNKIPRYQLLLDTFEQTGSWLGAKYGLGGVRIANDKYPANSAMAHHLSRNWHLEEGYQFTSRMGSLLNLVSRKIPPSSEFKENNFPYSAFVFPSASNLNIVLGDPARLAKEDRIKTGPRNGNEAQMVATLYLSRHRLDSYCHARSDHGTLSGGQHGLSMMKNNSQYYFYQVAPDKDLWMNRDTRIVSSLEKCLDWFALEARKPPY